MTTGMNTDVTILQSDQYNGSFTLPANYLTTGKTIRIIVKGYITVNELDMENIDAIIKTKLNTGTLTQIELLFPVFT